jgi:hypothetical protein
MTGEIIRFERCRDLRGGDARRPDPVAHDTTSPVRPASVVEWQVSRIARLLIELQEPIHSSEGGPALPLDRVRRDIVKARRVVTPWTSGEQRPGADHDGDPQPDVDDERLEWIYRELNRDA